MPLRTSLQRLQHPSRLAAIRATTPIARRPFTATSLRALKEDADRSAEEAEAAKQSQLRKQQRGEGHWHEELASSGESSVKADREGGKVDDHGAHMEELQEMGKKKGESGEL